MTSILSMLSGFKLAGTRLRRGLLAQAYGQASQILIRLLEVPLFLAFWGSERYGQWLVITTLPVLFALGDFGVSQSAVREMTMLTSAKKSEKALAVYRSAALFVLLVTVSIGLLVFALRALHLIDGMGVFTSLSAGELNVTLALLIAYTMISMQALLLFGALQSAGKYPLGFFLLANLRSLEFAGVALALVLGAREIAVAAAMVASATIAWLTLLACALHGVEWMRLGMGKASISVLKSLIRPSLAQMAFPVAQGISLQVLRILVGSALGPVAVTIFTMHRQLARLPSFATHFMLSVQGELGLAYGAADFERYRSLAVRSFRLLFLAVTVLGVGVFLASTQIFDVWSIGKVGFDRQLFGTLLFACLLEAFWRSGLAPVVAVNRQERVAVFYLVVQAIALPLILWRIGTGLHWVADVMVAGEFLVLVLVLAEFCRLTGSSVRSILALPAR
jgi:O-antigen/teichoic acid export membrane protein